ncbi:hypothetical protein JCM10296v2_005070 [Rhodotorula toruloides]
MHVQLPPQSSLLADVHSHSDRDDDNDLIELATTADLVECLDYFSTDPSLSSASSAHSLAKPAACITVKLEVIVEYDGPSLSETDAASSVWSAPSSWRRVGAAPASRAGSFGGEREAVLRRWRMQQQEATVDGEEEDAVSDDWIRRPAFAVAAGARTPIDSASSSASVSASAIDADNEQDWDTRTVSSISFAPARAPLSNAPLSRRPANVSEDALYPNFAPPPRWLASLGPAAQPPYPLPFSLSPYSAPRVPVGVRPERASGSGYPLHAFAPHPSYRPPPLFPPTERTFAQPAVRSVANSLDDFCLASPTQSLRERVQDLFAPSSDEDSLRGRGGGDPLLGREVQTGSLFAPARKAESSYTVTDSDADSPAPLPPPPPPPAHDKNSIFRVPARARNLVLAGEYWCADCGRKRYSCAVCEGFDLCRDTIPLRHDPSHILLKIPISLSSSSSSSALASAQVLASALPHPAPSPAEISEASEGSYLQEGDLTWYWSWWEKWYAQMQVLNGAKGQVEVSKHSWDALEGRTSAGATGERRERHTYPPEPPAPAAPPAPPAPPSLASQNSAICPTCEPLSTRIHDPTHTFLRLTHPLRRSLPSISQGLLPVLCLPPSKEHDEEDGEVVHRTVICDACGVRIKGAWMRCSAGHNPSHVFAALKRPVDLELLKSVTRITSRRPRGLVEWDLYA